MRPLITRHSIQEQTDRGRPHVLVVDDQKLNQVVAVSLLERLGCLVDVAESGQAAAEAVAATSYDLLFMDCQMFGMDGYQAAALIRKREGGGPRVPIIALTGHMQQSDRAQCLAAGMDDCLTKPLQFTLLEAMLRRWLKKDVDPGRREGE